MVLPLEFLIFFLGMMNSPSSSSFPSLFIDYQASKRPLTRPLILAMDVFLRMRRIGDSFGIQSTK